MAAKVGPSNDYRAAFVGRLVDHISPLLKIFQCCPDCLEKLKNLVIGHGISWGYIFRKKPRECERALEKLVFRRRPFLKSQIGLVGEEKYTSVELEIKLLTAFCLVKSCRSNIFKPVVGPVELQRNGRFAGLFTRERLIYRACVMNDALSADYEQTFQGLRNSESAKKEARH